MKDLGDKVGTAPHARRRRKQSRHLKSDDDIEQMKRLTDQLMQASHKIAEAMYQKASQSGPDPSKADRVMLAVEYIQKDIHQQNPLTMMWLTQIS